jgi:Co/Zn/Cd efflux system component
MKAGTIKKCRLFLFIKSMILTITVIYIIGGLISYWMLRVEHESEGQAYTFGLRLFNILFSLLSWLTVLIQLISAWFHKIKITGYWNRPIKKKTE